MPDSLNFKLAKPDKALDNFVDSYWTLSNPTELDRAIIVLPDGRIDLFFSSSKTEPFAVTLKGLETEPSKTTVLTDTKTFAISFKLLACEYLLNISIADLINSGKRLPADFWSFEMADLVDFDSFCQKANTLIKAKLLKQVDSRKLNLFSLIYSSHGAMTVKELSEKAFWSSRQINRYFSQQFGLSLKTYCSILRFRASFAHIKQGKLFPEQNFADQAHFIKAVKKLAGVIPKELSKNKNDRFIQFSILDKN